MNLEFYARARTCEKRITRKRITCIKQLLCQIGFKMTSKETNEIIASDKTLNNE